MGGVIAARGAQDAAALDQAGFVALVEPVLPAAYQLARAMLRSEIEAEDAVQEGVLNAWRHHHRFVAGSDMKPWLLTIVANECRRMRRSRWWSVAKWPARLEADQLPTAAPDQDLRRAIDRLPHDQKLAVTLRYYLDLSFEDVARVMKTSTKAAKSRTYRALERLRLDPEVIGDERD
jgi:RNA polymerase sigma factor (sigma-70 family)